MTLTALRDSMTRPVLLVAVVSTVALGCTRQDQSGPDVEVDKLFTLLPPSYTGVTFENRLTDTEESNVFTYRNYYNGGGVGIGDVNDDGLPDLYLTANQLPNKLYLNRGNFQFEDVTDRAGVAGTRPWTTGVAMVDLNADGLLDVYVCNAGGSDGDDRANELFINNGPGPDGVPTFTEAAEQYGVADRGVTTHAAFFDYDRDSDLDLYVLNNSYRPVSSFGLQNVRHVRHEGGGDRLYRNDGGRFVDVSDQAGIYGSEIAFGLGVTVGDVNRDGWPDLYISNDFFERDYLYLNEGDGTFAEVLERDMPSISLSSMGADVADLNNDGYPEIYVTDMLPESDRRLKTTSTFESWRLYRAKLENGFHHQFMRNTLHLNNADGTFSEIGQMAGVSATDWSWSALLADFDNDGFKDIFVSNGIARDITDQDFIAFFANELNRLAARKGTKLGYLDLLERIPSNPIPNYLFANNGDLTFRNVAAEWGLDTPGFSNGSAYGDLDNDGDLDLVVNNVNRAAFVYRNEADSLLGGRYLKLRLEGEGGNRHGIGARVTLREGERSFYIEQMPTRGFQSSVDPILLVGLGPIDTLDAVIVEWPDDRVEVLTGVATNQTLTLRQRDAASGGTEWAKPPGQTTRPLFAYVTDGFGPEYVHRENDFVDFSREHLIPRMLSTEGPALAVADVDGDGLEDVFLGGAKESPGQVYLQQRDGRFRNAGGDAFARDAGSEDVGAAFFDADGDGDLDLYVVSGGHEFSDLAPALQDRLYLNDGRGHFTKTNDRLPTEYASGSAVVPFDYDADGDTDLFVGGRTVPSRYGLDAQSLLFQNDGRGFFRNVTRTAAPDLENVGMVTDAVWADYDRDGHTDLIVAGDWMPITLFRANGLGTFARVEAPGLEHSHGWWNRLLADDFDGDGDTDLIAGNLGLNTKLRAAPDRPLSMLVADFDYNGHVEHVVSYASGEESYPMLLRDELIMQVPMLSEKYPKYADYAGETVSDLFTEDQRRNAVARYAYTLSTSYVENLGNGRFKLSPLPAPCQVAPVYGLLSGDFDRDGHKDLLLAGNFDGFKPDVGRAAASYGTFLKGDGRGGFRPVPARESGFRTRGQVRHLKTLSTHRGRRLVLAVRNNDSLQIFEHL